MQLWWAISFTLSHTVRGSLKWKMTWWSAGVQHTYSFTEGKPDNVKVGRSGRHAYQCGWTQARPCRQRHAFICPIWTSLNTYRRGNATLNTYMLSCVRKEQVCNGCFRVWSRACLIGLACGDPWRPEPARYSRVRRLQPGRRGKSCLDNASTMAWVRRVSFRML